MGDRFFFQGKNSLMRGFPEHEFSVISLMINNPVDSCRLTCSLCTVGLSLPLIKEQLQSAAFVSRYRASEICRMLMLLSLFCFYFYKSLSVFYLSQTDTAVDPLPVTTYHHIKYLNCYNYSNCSLQSIKLYHFHPSWPHWVEHIPF